MKQCPRCGASSDALSIMCGRCGLRLPNPELSTPGLQLRVDQITQRYTEIFIACDRLKHDQLGLDEFGEFLKQWGASLRREKPRDLMIDDELEENEPSTAVEFEIDPSFVHFGAGLDVICPILDDGDFDRLDRGLKIMQEGNHEMLGLKPDDIGQITADTTIEITCPMCGAKNLAQEALCKDCGAKLPRQAGNCPELSHKPLMGRLEQFRQACVKVTNKSWSLHDFGSFLENMQDTLKAKREVFISNLGDYAEYATEEVELATSGMNEYELGMEELWAYIETKDPACIQRGMDLVICGNEKINQAMAMNRSLRSERADEFGYV